MEGEVCICDTVEERGTDSDGWTEEEEEEESELDEEAFKYILIVIFYPEPFPALSTKKPCPPAVCHHHIKYNTAFLGTAEEMHRIEIWNLFFLSSMRKDRDQSGDPYY